MRNGKLLSNITVVLRPEITGGQAYKASMITYQACWDWEVCDKLCIILQVLQYLHDIGRGGTLANSILHVVCYLIPHGIQIQVELSLVAHNADFYRYRVKNGVENRCQKADWCGFVGPQGDCSRIGGSVCEKNAPFMLRLQRIDGGPQFLGSFNVESIPEVLLLRLMITKIWSPSGEIENVRTLPIDPVVEDLIMGQHSISSNSIYAWTWSGKRQRTSGGEVLPFPPR